MSDLTDDSETDHDDISGADTTDTHTRLTPPPTGEPEQSVRGVRGPGKSLLSSYLVVCNFITTLCS